MFPLRTAVRRFSSALSPRDVVIVGLARTPIGSIGGALASQTAPQLGAVAIKAALARAGVKAGSVDEVIMGNVVSAGLGQAPARQACLFAGLPDKTVCTTINKMCASGMKSVAYGVASITMGHHDVVVAGGMESMSNAPYLLPQARFGLKYGHGAMIDSLVKDGLWDVYNDVAMGTCAEKAVTDLAISRGDQDAFAIESYKRAAAATASNAYAHEIAPVVLQRKGKEPLTVTSDEGVSKVDFSRIATLRPVFKAQGGTITAANSSSLSDGASAVVLMSWAHAQATGAVPLAVIRGFGDAEQAPIDFPTAPSLAVPVALKRAGLTLADVDYHEINEAFAAVVLANATKLGLLSRMDRINAFGGAVALGHPIGSSGARILCTLLSVLRAKDASIGVASICNGGGGASAMVLERLR